MTSFPTSLPTITAPGSTDNLDSSGVVHDTLHDTEIGELLAGLAKIGVDTSGVNTSLDYKASHHKHTGADGSAQGTLAGSLSDVAISSIIQGQTPLYNLAATQFLNTTVEHLLASVAGVDLNTATATTLFTVPTGRSAIITRIVVRLASISLTLAAYSFGFNSASFNDVIADAAHTELTGNTLFTILIPKVGAKRGAAADVLKIKANTLQGAAATVTIDVFGYLF